MKISFSINYRTQWGESLYISGNVGALGGDTAADGVVMSPESADVWKLSIEVPDSCTGFDYCYSVRRDSHTVRREWGRPHRFVAGNGIARYKCHDSWSDIPDELPYYSSAFTDGILMRKTLDKSLPTLAATLRLRVAAPMVKPDEVLAISGNCDILGNWDPKHAMLLNDSEYPFWNVNIPLSALSLPTEYKFVVLKKSSLEPVCWENRSNRIFNESGLATDETVIISGLTFANPRRDWRGAGTAVPVFSLRSEEDLGCGDFLDLKGMIDWCARTGQNVLQTLPINDTTKTKTWTDSYPYSANSSFALHPMYLRPQAIGKLKSAEMRKNFEREGARLNALSQIDYEKATDLKERYARALYKELGKRQMNTEAFRKFVSANEDWLIPYAAWRLLRDMHGTPDTSLWGEFATYDDEKVKKFVKEHEAEAGFFLFVQYHLDKQLQEVRDYAHQHGVVLKGDIPIGVGRESVDTWKNPRLFNMDCQAGAPPDDFSVLGQNWGFPTYNWDEMAKDGFRWWKERFGKMAEYFDAYRIDHILGFFRIWQIPMDAVHGLLGYFNPALPYSPEEMRHNYDFWIQVPTQTTPLILEWMLTDFFGDLAQTAKENYLRHVEGDRYELRPEVDTQRKVEDKFATLEPTDANKRIKDGLLGLIDNVLFIEDPYNRGHYHPRIAAQFSYQYRCLNDYERRCFDRLYNDFYYRRHNEFWAGKALWKLPPIIFSTGMLTCAEDLGMIPDCVPDVMARLQILSLEIQRMPKDPKVEFGNTWHYPYNSVCTSSTHDMPGIRGWWESDHARAQRYFNQVLGEPGEAPYFAEPWICSKIMNLMVKSPSMLSINPLQDWLATDGAIRRQDPREEQINDPSNPHHYWRYRMHLTLGELLADDAFCDSIRSMISESGR